MAPSDQLEYPITALSALVAGTRPDQMTLPTPCAKWTVRDLFNHFIGGGQMFAAAFRGEQVAMDPDAPAPDLTGDDPQGAYRAAIDAFRAGIDSPGAMDRIISLPFGQVPAPVTLQILYFDLLVHCWDLATATGQAFEPPADVVAKAEEMARQMIAPEARDGDTFAAEVTPPPDATPMQRLVAFTGRQP
jgi:uncharacterized protein (TIGR03086 family)